MKRVIASTLAALAMTACASGPLTLNDNTIIRGERIGDVQVGMPLSQLLALKGTPSRTIPIKNTAATTYVFDGLTVAAHDEVYWIIAKDARFQTPEGLRVGSEQIFARGTLGRPECVVSRTDVTLYDYGDLYFEVDDNTGQVTQIGVQKETQSCAG